MKASKLCNFLFSKQNFAWHSTQKQQVRLQMTAATAATADESEFDDETQTNVQNDTTEWQSARPLSEMPTIGNFEAIRSHLPGGKYYKKDVKEIFELMRQEYGDTVHLPGLLTKPGMILSHNPKDFETIFRNEGAKPTRFGMHTLHYHRKKHRPEFFDGVGGLLTTHGEKWGQFRSKVNPVLMQPKNVRLYYQKMSNVNQEFIQRIKALRDPHTNEVPANFEDYINRWALESVSVVAFDKRLGLLKANQIDPMIQKLFDGITAFNHLSAQIETKPTITSILPLLKRKRAMKALDGILEATTQCVNEALERVEMEKKNGIEKTENEKGVLEKLLKIDRKVAIVMSLDMLMAGVDTTSSSFAATMLHLAKNPEKQEKLREEILRILPNKDSEFTHKSMNDAKYLRACIKEALRFVPLVVGNGRTVPRDIVVNGFRVPKGTRVTMVATSINRDEQYYPHADKYLPERWLRNQRDDTNPKGCPNSIKSSNPFVYLPFGFGPRSCIGRRLAEMELELGVARVIRNFNISFNYPIDNAFKMLLVNVPNIPLKFQFTDLEK